MRSSRCFRLALGVLLLAAPLSSQSVNTMRPEEIEAQKHSSPEDLRARAANLQLQKDVKELAGLCAERYRSQQLCTLGSTRKLA